MTIEVYELYPHFITSDPRTKREGLPGSSSYNVNGPFMQKRFDCFFHEYDLQDKRVLDLGCCVGAMGAYALSKGAKYYLGVEYGSDLANIAITNLSNSFDTERWHIENDSVENFTKNLSENFDIVVLSGIIYAIFDPIPLLLSLYNKTDMFIIESMQPRMLDIFPPEVKEKFEDSQLWKKLLEKSSFVQYKTTVDFITKTRINGSYPNIGFFIHFLNLLGFKDSKVVYDLLNTNLSDIYNASGRFGERFEKHTDTKEKLGYVEI